MQEILLRHPLRNIRRARISSTPAGAELPIFKHAHTSTSEDGELRFQAPKFRNKGAEIAQVDRGASTVQVEIG